MACRDRLKRISELAEEAFVGLRHRQSEQDVRLDILAGFMPALWQDGTLLPEAALLCRQRARRRAQSPQTGAQAEALASSYRAAADLLDRLAVDLDQDVAGGLGR